MFRKYKQNPYLVVSKITEADFERAFQKFKNRLDAMSDEDFFLTLGTTIEELRGKAKEKVVCDKIRKLNIKEK